MNLRQANISDIGVVMDIERDAFIPAIRETEETFAERIRVFPEGFLLLQDDSGRTCGYFASERWAQVHTERAFFELGHSAALSHKSDGRILYISSMGILSSYRGSGLGTYLFNTAGAEICTTCKGITRLALLVNEVWKGAHHIYTQAGFTETARLDQFFPAADDGSPTCGIIMERAV